MVRKLLLLTWVLWILPISIANGDEVEECIYQFKQMDYTFARDISGFRSDKTKGDKILKDLCVSFKESGASKYLDEILILVKRFKGIKLRGIRPVQLAADLVLYEKGDKRTIKKINQQYGDSKKASKIFTIQNISICLDGIAPYDASIERLFDDSWESAVTFCRSKDVLLRPQTAVDCAQSVFKSVPLLKKKLGKDIFDICGDYGKIGLREPGKITSCFTQMEKYLKIEENGEGDFQLENRRSLLQLCGSREYYNEFTDKKLAVFYHCVDELATVVPGLRALEACGGFDVSSLHTLGMYNIGHDPMVHLKNPDHYIKCVLKLGKLGVNVEEVASVICRTQAFPSATLERLGGCIGELKEVTGLSEQNKDDKKIISTIAQGCVNDDGAYSFRFKNLYQFKTCVTKLKHVGAAKALDLCKGIPNPLFFAKCFSELSETLVPQYDADIICRNLQRFQGSFRIIKSCLKDHELSKDSTAFTRPYGNALTNALSFIGAPTRKFLQLNEKGDAIVRSCFESANIVNGERRVDVSEQRRSQSKGEQEEKTLHFDSGKKEALENWAREHSNYK